MQSFQGTHTNLLETCELYKQLVQRQLLLGLKTESASFYINCCFISNLFAGKASHNALTDVSPSTAVVAKSRSTRSSREHSLPRFSP